MFAAAVAIISGLIDNFRIRREKRVRHGLKYTGLFALFGFFAFLQIGYFDDACMVIYTCASMVIYSVVFDHWLNLLRGKKFYYLSESSRPEKYFARLGWIGYIFYNFFKVFLICFLLGQYYIIGMC